MAIGMALVVGTMAILVAGALKGFQGYRFAMKIVESKMVEMDRAVAFRDSVNRLLAVDKNGLQAKRLKDALERDVRLHLKEYADALNFSITTGRADDDGFTERTQIQK